LPSSGGGPGRTTEAEAVAAVIRQALEVAIEAQASPEVTRAEAEADLPAEIVADIGEVAGDSRRSYVVGLLVMLALPGVRGEALDLTVPPLGGRAMTQKTGTVLADLHIPAPKDAFENIGKNSKVLTRGNFPAFDRVLVWASGDDADLGQVEAAYSFVVVLLAQTARSVAPKPRALRLARLTFATTQQLLDDMLDMPSQGAHEQFIVAAVLNAALEQVGSGERVETKNLNASDKSSRAAGDVVVYRKGEIVAALETTANDWRDKISPVLESLKNYKPGRSIIIAPIAAGEGGEAIEAVTPEDIAVLDIRGFVAVGLAVLNRPGKERALLMLYDYLDRDCPSAEVVNAYVARLGAAGLVDDD
jgi:hypothetical protein